MIKADKIFRKLDKIPAAPNFVRYNFDDLVKTTKSYVAFAKGMPTVSYVEPIKLIKDVVFGMSPCEQAKEAVRRMNPSPSKAVAISLVDAFCEFAANRAYQATLAYADYTTSFSIGRKLFVPVKPTLVSREGGKFKPVFIFGWKSVPLNKFQRRLLMTILEDALFSLTDFQDSDAEIIFFPEVDGRRRPEVWNRGDYDLLSDRELGNQMELFLSAREMAFPIIAEWLNARQVQPAAALPETDTNQIPLDFGFTPRDPRA